MDHHIAVRRSSLLIAALVVVAAGCPAPSKDDIIKESIKGGMSVKKSVLRDSQGIFSDYKVYRDGKKDGVVFEYIYAKGAVVDKSKLTPSKVKKEMVKQFKSDRNAASILKADVYTRFVYKTHDGESLCDVKITKKDL